MFYLRVWCRKECIDCEKVDEKAPGLYAQLIGSHDVPAILGLYSGVSVIHVVELVEVDAF